ncbi:MSMEG_0569 family flavin-dependent oxidoreductase [Synechococcus sp. PCC 7336]|uniref:MSMEG_0569 family flavin-dependent oxidoreductase n=1 Tax=Synechococcus sp. PCC 7336 TaxID=195250 RepID=UPI00036EAC4E|nr:MSMEG_0569 family flavin-dependent oxidoreductase [Synechococcus sp. PCC 7336]
MQTHYPSIIIGGGQAGLSMSYCLKQRGIESIIFEKHRVAHTWRSQRWDTFCLVTPNWQCQLPGFPYTGPDPNGFMLKHGVVSYIEDYAKFFDAPVKEGVEVKQVKRNADLQTYSVSTSIGDFTADSAIVATGSYHVPKIPRIAERLPTDITQLHSSTYKTPESLPEGAVLVVGSGQSGCQIAEDLHLANREVYLSVGGAPRSPRMYRGKDVVDWLDRMGYYDTPIDAYSDPDKVRKKTNHYLTGRDGGREINLRQFALEGMQLAGRLKDIDGGKIAFNGDLQQNLDKADAVADSIKVTIDTYIEDKNIDAPLEPPSEAIAGPRDAILELDCTAANIKTVIWCTGFESNFSWIDVPVFNGEGYPKHDRGVTSAEGLYFLGLPWLYTWGSGRLSGIARDAQYLADRIVAQQKMVRSELESAADIAVLGS